MVMRTYVTIFISLSLMLHAQKGYTQSPQISEKIVLVSAVKNNPKQAWAEAEQAIVAEFGLMNIPVEVVEGKATTADQRLVELESFALSLNAVAAVSIHRPAEPSAFVELWLNDRVTGKITHRKISIENSSAPDAVTIVALRTVDMLRASLIEMRMDDLNSNNESPLSPSRPSDEIIHVVENIPIKNTSNVAHKISIATGLTLMGSPGGAGLRGGFSLGLGWHPGKIGVEVETVIAPWGKNIVAHSATTSINLFMIRGWIVWHILRKNIVRPAVSFGAGELLVGGKGIEGEDYVLTSDLTYVGYLGGGAHVDFVLNDIFRFGLGLKTGFVLPEVKFYHGDNLTANLGRPLVEGILKIELQFP